MVKGKSISRRAKVKANQKQAELLMTISRNTLDMQKYGEPYFHLQSAVQMERIGLISNAELNDIADILLTAEILRIKNHVYRNLKNKFEQLAAEKGIDIEELYQKNNLFFSVAYDEYFVDTSKIQVGMIVKDYKTMCVLLGEKEKGGNARNEQMENWLRYFDYEKLKYGNSFIIMEIYDEPITKEEKKYRHSNFVNELKVLILKEISKQEINDKGNIICFTSYSRLIKRLHVINPLFYVDTINFFLTKHSELFSKENIKWNYQIFRSNTFRKVKDSVRYALEALEKDDMLRIEKYDNIGVKTENGAVMFHQASDDEKAYITTAKKLIANRMGYRNSLDACLYNAAKFNLLLNAYYKAKYGWDIVYFQLKLIANQKNVMKHINEYTALSDNHSVTELSPVEIKSYQEKYNERIVNELRKQAGNFQEVKKKNYIRRLQQSNDTFAELDEKSIDMILKLNENKDINKYGGGFPDRQNVLIDYLVKFDNENTKSINSFLCNIQKEAQKSIDLDSDDLIPELDFVD